jgi:hypothetical protein
VQNVWGRRRRAGARSLCQRAGRVLEKYLRRCWELEQSGWQYRRTIDLRRNSAQVRRTLIRESLNVGSIASLAAYLLNSDYRLHEQPSYCNHFAKQVLLAHLVGKLFRKDCADVRKAALTLFLCAKGAKLRAFAQALRNFTQRFPGPNELFRGCFLFSIRHMCYYFTQRVNPGSSDWSWLLKRADSGRSGGSYDGQR